MKQSATDPLSGKIDVGILTTGLSTTARKKRADLVANIKEMLKKKGKVPTVNWNKLYTEIKENSQIVSKRTYINTCVFHLFRRIDAFFRCHKIEQFPGRLKRNTIHIHICLVISQHNCNFTFDMVQL